MLPISSTTPSKSTIRHPELLCPEMRKKALEFCRKAEEHGIPVLIYCTYRSPEEQWLLYEQGRTKPGKIVTWTRKGKHNAQDGQGRPASRAFDCVPLISGKALWNDREKYIDLGRIGAEIGLRWGGDWDQDGKPFERGEYDSPHFELP